MSVYFIQERDNPRGPVKIGHSVDPFRRFLLIRANSPVDLTLRATIAGDADVERRFHNRFRDSHMRQEWFYWSEDMEHVLSAIIAGQFDVGSLPEPFGVQKSASGKTWRRERVQSVAA